MSQEATGPPETASAQLVALRLVIVSSVIDVVAIGFAFGAWILIPLPRGFLITETWYFLAPMLLMIIHHFGRYVEIPVITSSALELNMGISTFGPTLLPIKRWIDIALTLLEVGCVYKDPLIMCTF